MVGSQSAGSSAGLQQAHLAGLGHQDARLDQPGHAGVLGLGELLGDAVIALGKADLLEPGQRPAGIGVEIAFLLGQRLVEGLVDQGQRGAHRDRLALGVEHLGVAGIDRHAGADGRLRQVHRGDVAGLQMRQRLRQFGLERGDELAASGGGSGKERWRQTRTMLEARALVTLVPIIRHRSVRTGQVPLIAKPASITAPRKVSHPVLVVPSPPALSDCLKAS